MTRVAATVTLAGGLTLSYAERGDPSGPAVVMLPGPTDSWVSYAPVLDRMPPWIRSIAVSQRGHGESDKPPTGYRVEDFAADVLPLLDELGVERAVLAGHSGSCLVCRRVAIDRPDRVAGLVLEASPTTLHGHPGLEQLVTSIRAELDDPIDRDFAHAFVVDASSDEVDPDTLEQFVDEVQKVPARVWREMFTALLHYDDVGELGLVTARTLLIWGDGDTLVGRDMQEQLAVALPCEALLVYAGAGHAPRWEDPLRFASDVTAFVARLSAATD
jgi:pimeloyl-ACP methyl ester carboxylesterase